MIIKNKAYNVINILIKFLLENEEQNNKFNSSKKSSEEKKPNEDSFKNFKKNQEKLKKPFFDQEKMEKKFTDFFEFFMENLRVFLLGSLALLGFAIIYKLRDENDVITFTVSCIYIFFIKQK